MRNANPKTIGLLPSIIVPLRIGLSAQFETSADSEKVYNLVRAIPGINYFRRDGILTLRFFISENGKASKLSLPVDFAKFSHQLVLYLKLAKPSAPPRIFQTARIVSDRKSKLELANVTEEANWWSCHQLLTLDDRGSAKVFMELPREKNPLKLEINFSRENGGFAARAVQSRPIIQVYGRRLQEMIQNNLSISQPIKKLYRRTWPKRSKPPRWREVFQLTERVG